MSYQKREFQSSRVLYGDINGYAIGDRGALQRWKEYFEGFLNTNCCGNCNPKDIMMELEDGFTNI